MSSRSLEVKYGIPQPGTGKPAFKAEGVTTIRLEDFPANIMPSGGLSGVVSKSEMYMVETCVPTEMTWRDPAGKVIGSMRGTWSMIGRYPWEIALPGMFMVEISRQRIPQGFVEFEVV